MVALVHDPYSFKGVVEMDAVLSHRDDVYAADINVGEEGHALGFSSIPTSPSKDELRQRAEAFHVRLAQKHPAFLAPSVRLPSSNHNHNPNPIANTSPTTPISPIPSFQMMGATLMPYAPVSTPTMRPPAIQQLPDPRGGCYCGAEGLVLSPSTLSNRSCDSGCSCGSLSAVPSSCCGGSVGDMMIPTSASTTSSVSWWGEMSPTCKPSAAVICSPITSPSTFTTAASADLWTAPTPKSSASSGSGRLLVVAAPSTSAQDDEGEGESPEPLVLRLDTCRHFQHWRRLRTKKRVDQFLCMRCFKKWRVPRDRLVEL